MDKESGAFIDNCRSQTVGGEMTYSDTISSVLSMAIVIMFCRGVLVLNNYFFSLLFSISMSQ